MSLIGSLLTMFVVSVLWFVFLSPMVTSYSILLIKINLDAVLDSSLCLFPKDQVGKNLTVSGMIIASL